MKRKGMYSDKTVTKNAILTMLCSEMNFPTLTAVRIKYGMENYIINTLCLHADTDRCIRLLDPRIRSEIRPLSLNLKSSDSDVNPIDDSDVDRFYAFRLLSAGE